MLGVESQWGKGQWHDHDLSTSKDLADADVANQDFEVQVSDDTEETRFINPPPLPPKVIS